MPRLHLSPQLAFAALAAACTADGPTVPSDRTYSLHGMQLDAGPGEPELHSKNVKLLANLPRSNSETQSDITFAGRYAYAGNYAGFRIIDISDPENPSIVSVFPCNGAQGDVSVYGDLLFQSVDHPQSSTACNSTDVTGSTPGMFEGIRIFDVSNRAAPVHIASVPTDCGSHTHTLVPDPAHAEVLLYVSSYPSSALGTGPNCQEPHGYISIVHVPLTSPPAATVSKYFLDSGTQVDGFSACHDIVVFLEIHRAAASCLTENQLWNISDPGNPQFLWRFDDATVDRANGDLWHSAAFSWDGSVVAFGDESGGGADFRCTDPTDAHGRIWFVNVTTGALLDTYKIPRAEESFCTVHYFNFVPLGGGRRVLVSAWYTGGMSVVDVDKLLGGASEVESEIGFYRPDGAITWSAYWYNGFIYTNDIIRGVDVMLLSDKFRAGARKLSAGNPQTQEQGIF
jgi:hypothetical protein